MPVPCMCLAIVLSCYTALAPLDRASSDASSLRPKAPTPRHRCTAVPNTLLLSSSIESSLSKTRRRVQHARHLPHIIHVLSRRSVSLRRAGQRWRVRLSQQQLRAAPPLPTPSVSWRRTPLTPPVWIPCNWRPAAATLTRWSSWRAGPPQAARVGRRKAAAAAAMRQSPCGKTVAARTVRSRFRCGKIAIARRQPSCKVCANCICPCLPCSCNI